MLVYLCDPTKNNLTCYYKLASWSQLFNSPLWCYEEIRSLIHKCTINDFWSLNAITKLFVFKYIYFFNFRIQSLQLFLMLLLF